ncbi:MAG: integrase core domain-containing protein, partial [Candidatus Nomurabacteria bacterium]|nr:integrase core domain-containing protein [Candidatus Nomurabacteria bacterium]
MSKTGVAMTYESILPKQYNNIKSVSLSSEAKRRLCYIDFYFKHGKNASLTIRHFCIARATFYKWLKRYHKYHLGTLENRSTKPHHARKAEYDSSFVKLVEALRQDYPTYSARKLDRIIRRDYQLAKYYSRATIGRIIKRHSFYFGANLDRSLKLRKAAKKAWQTRKVKVLKPYHLPLNKPHQYIEFDMKHISSDGNKKYAFIGIDPYTKENIISVAASPSSKNALVAIKAIVEHFGDSTKGPEGSNEGYGLTIINDNGSENMAEVYDYLQAQGIPQLFTRPYAPKEKPHVENLIGKLQQECLDQHRCYMNLSELRQVITKWLKDYHFFRPHEALSDQTPAEFCATIGITILRAEV